MTVIYKLITYNYDFCNTKKTNTKTDTKTKTRAKAKAKTKKKTSTKFFLLQIIGYLFRLCPFDQIRGSDPNGLL